MSDTEYERDSLQSEPPMIGWFVIEVDVEHDRDDPLFTSIDGPFPSEEKAKHERGRKRRAWEYAKEEFDGEPDFKDWHIVKKYISDYQIEQLERHDEESYRIMTDAASAIGTSLLAGTDIALQAGDLND